MRSRLAINIGQPTLFSELTRSTTTTSYNLEVQEFSLPNAEVSYYSKFFTSEESHYFFHALNNEVKWRQDKISLYGREIDLPRETAWYGDTDKNYTFSGIRLTPEPWLPALLDIRQRIEKVAQVRFNSVMLNLYRDGKDGISWHTDAEPELGRNPIIGSVSFGGTRRFMLRHRHDKQAKCELELANGSFLLMGGETQHFWQHQIPKTSKTVAPRINLTFRTIL